MYVCRGLHEFLSKHVHGFPSYLGSLGPHSLLEEEDDSGDAVVEAAEQLLQLVGVPGILSDVAVLFHPFLQVFKLKIQSNNECLITSLLASQVDKISHS